MKTMEDALIVIQIKQRGEVVVSQEEAVFGGAMAALHGRAWNINVTNS